MAISMDLQWTFRLETAFSSSFSAFRRHIVAVIILTVTADIPLLLWYIVVIHYPGFISFFSEGEFLCETILYGAIIYGVIQDLAGRRVAIPRR
jgi:hypothetical protein